ncbi:MAG: AI-2E family transporter [Eubacteriales bacterium]|nr:AI-2E family transporter [Lachnospiraceae bacterium]MDO5126416.1 AI-2E family transporter [Eubacteriales bacterium]
MGKKWNSNYIKLGITITISLCACIVFAEVIKGWKGIVAYLSKIGSALTPIAIGIVIAYLLNPAMIGIRRGLAYIISKAREKDYDDVYRKAKIPALIISLALFLGLVVGFLWLVIPQIITSLNDLVEKAPGYFESAQSWVQKVFAKNDMLEGKFTQAIKYFQENVFDIFKTTVMPNIDTIAIKLSSGVMIGVKAILNCFLGLIVTVYLLVSKETLLAQGKKMIYCIFSRKTGNKIMRGAAYANSVFGGFINGKIIDSVIIGILCLIFTSAVGYQYAVLISVIVGVTNIIPFFGPFIGAVPGALLALMDDPIMMVIFVVWILILQQFDGNILGPLILGDTTGLSSIWVLIAILVGGDLFGVKGMILGVPVFACLYAFFAVLLRDGLRKKKLSSDTEDYYRLVGFDEETDEPIYRDRHEKRMSLRKKRKKELLFARFKKTMKNKEGVVTEDDPYGEIDHSFDRALEQFMEEQEQDVENKEKCLADDTDDKTKDRITK